MGKQPQYIVYYFLAITLYFVAMVAATALKSLGRNTVPVQVRLRAPKTRKVEPLIRQ